MFMDCYPYMPIDLKIKSRMSKLGYFYITQYKPWEPVCLNYP